MSTANRYRPLAVRLAIMLVMLCAPPFAVNTVAQDRPVEQPEVAPPQRHGRQGGFERFSALAERLRTRAKEEEEDLAELIELVRAWRMMKEVGLSEEEALNMLKLGREMKRQSGQVAQQRKRVLLELGKLLDDPDAEDEAIKKQLDKLERINERQRKLVSDYERKMLDGLTVRQQAKFQLFKTRFERDIRRLIELVRWKQPGAHRDRSWERRRPPAAGTHMRPHLPGPRPEPTE